MCVCVCGRGGGGIKVALGASKPDLSGESYKVKNALPCTVLYTVPKATDLNTLFVIQQTKQKKNAAVVPPWSDMTRKTALLFIISTVDTD